MKQKGTLAFFLLFFLYFDFDLCYNLNTSYTWLHSLSLTFTFSVPYKDWFIGGAATINFFMTVFLDFFHA